MATWNDLLDDVMPEIVGSPPIALVTHHIRNAVIQFLDKTKLLRKTTVAMDWPGGVGEKPLDSATFTTELVSASERVIEVRSAAWLGKPLDPAGEDELVTEFGNDWATLTGDPKFYTENNGTILLVPAPPTTVDALTLAISYSLMPTASSFPDRVLSDHRRALAQGAKASLMYMANKPWSDPIAADINYREYSAAIASARGKAAKQTSKNQQHTKPHPF